MQFERASRMEPTGSAFDKALFAGYLDLAREELDETDLTDAYAFARRAERAADAETVTPEAIAGRALPEASVVELSDARARLVVALSNGVRVSKPAMAAQAQLSFDCWMQEQEEGFQRDDIAGCRDRFTRAMAALEGAKPVAAADKTDGIMHRARAQSPAAPTKHEDVVLYFGFNSATLEQPTKKAVDTTASAARRLGVGTVVVTGHADRAGTPAFNMKLSRKRADAIAKALIEAGVPAALIQTRAFGEAKPAVPTADGVRELRNRRVEIGIKTATPRTALQQ